MCYVNKSPSLSRHCFIDIFNCSENQFGWELDWYQLSQVTITSPGQLLEVWSFRHKYISKLSSPKDKIPRPGCPDYKPKLATTGVIGPPQGLTIFSYCPHSLYIVVWLLTTFFSKGFIAFVTYKLMLPFHEVFMTLESAAAYHTKLAFRFVWPACGPLGQLLWFWIQGHIDYFSFCLYLFLVPLSLPLFFIFVFRFFSFVYFLQLYHNHIQYKISQYFKNK